MIKSVSIFLRKMQFTGKAWLGGKGRRGAGREREMSPSRSI
jgi:hypothetical protein